MNLQTELEMINLKSIPVKPSKDLNLNLNLQNKKILENSYKINSLIRYLCIKNVTLNNSSFNLAIKVYNLFNKLPSTYRKKLVKDILVKVQNLEFTEYQLNYILEIMLENKNYNLSSVLKALDLSFPKDSEIYKDLKELTKENIPRKKYTYLLLKKYK